MVNAIKVRRYLDCCDLWINFGLGSCNEMDILNMSRDYTQDVHNGNMKSYRFVFKDRKKTVVKIYEALAGNDAVASGYARGACITEQADTCEIYLAGENGKFIARVKPGPKEAEDMR